MRARPAETPKTAGAVGLSLVAVFWLGLIILLPAILGYTYWSYSVFKGKVAADAGYH